MAFDPKTTPTPSPPLLAFLRTQLYGHNDMTQEMYDYWGGDDVLKELKKFDPDAKVETTELSGGEGGSGGTGKKFVFDMTKVPGTSNIVPGAEYKKGDNSNNAGLKDPSKVWYDKNYGWISSTDNVRQHKGNQWLEIGGPLAVGIGGPLAGAGLAAAGIGGGAGFTSAVTGAAAGLPAGSIAGSSGVATGAGLNAIRSGVNTTQGALRNSSSGGGFNPLSLVGPALGIGGSFIPGASSVMPYLQAGMLANRLINR